MYKNVIKSVYLIVSVLSLASCASIQGLNNCDVHSASQLPSLYPSEYGVTLISTQHIIIKTKKDKFEFVSLLEIHPYQLSLAALTPVGQKLFQLQYQQQKLDYSSQAMPDNFEPAFLLTDISLIYGKEKSLQQCFSQAKIPFTLSRDQNNTRLVRIGGTDDISIRYSSESVWGSNITYTNHTRNYSIEIKSLGVERL